MDAKNKLIVLINNLSNYISSYQQGKHNNITVLITNITTISIQIKNLIYQIKQSKLLIDISDPIIIFDQEMKNFDTIIKKNTITENEHILHMDDDTETQSLIQAAKIYEENQIADDLKRKNLEIKKLYQDLSTIQKIMEDMNIMVHNQDDIVNSIEKNVISSDFDIEEGGKILNQEKKKQCKDYKCKCITSIICVIVVSAIFLIIIFSIKN
jgi:hypothetical protein